jgi:hypothetical protein
MGAVDERDALQGIVPYRDNSPRRNGPEDGKTGRDQYRGGNAKSKPRMHFMTTPLCSYMAAG